MQTEYRHQFVAGTPGLVSDTTPNVIDSRAVEGDNMEFGIGVVVGSVPGETVRVGVGTFEGVSVNTWVKELDMDGETVRIPEASSISVMRWGRIWVKLDTGASPAYNDSVFLMPTGLFSTSGGTSINGRFLRVDVGGGLAEIELFS